MAKTLLTTIETQKGTAQDVEAGSGDPTGIQRGCACRGWIRTAKDHVELNVVRYMQQYKTSFCRYIVTKGKGQHHKANLDCL